MDYAYIIIPLIVLIASQAVKLLTDGIKGNFDIRNLATFYGGMPSSHTAFAVSIATLVGLRTGFESAVFGLAMVFTLLIMRDAVALRNVIGQHAKMFNRFRGLIPSNQRQDLPILREQMGHSIYEVLAGLIFGAALTYLLTLLPLA